MIFQNRRIFAIVFFLLLIYPVQAAANFSKLLMEFNPHISRPMYIAAKVPRDHGQSTKKKVSYRSSEKPGTIIISNSARTLHYILGDDQAEQYTISVGRDGFTWTGLTTIGRKAEWPDWRPPSEMKKREPGLPDIVPAGPFNPLGARALYLYRSNKDTLYRIHGTNNSKTIGGYETSGCFRLSNRDILELYQKVSIGSKIIVQN